MSKTASPMGIKWKIFLVINIILLALSSITYIALCIGFFSEGKRSGMDWLIFSLVSICSLIAVANNLLNHYILRKHFPDKELPRPLRIVHTIFGFLYVIYLILLLLLIISLTNDVKDISAQTTAFIVFFYCLIMFLLLGIILFIIQIGLKRVIGRSYRDKIADMINHIGSNPDQ
jgi:amino acid transporter